MLHLQFPQIDDTYEWWKDKQLLAEFDVRTKLWSSVPTKVLRLTNWMHL